GNALQLFQFETQELPDVPPPTKPLTLLGSLNPYAGPWGYAQAAHLLRRTGFGLKKAEVDHLLTLSMDAAVNKVLTVPGNLPAPPVNNYNNPDYTDPVVLPGQTWVNQPFSLDAEGYRIESWRGWWTELMVNQQYSIQERMVFFWHNHFATQTNQVFWGRSAYEYNQMLRQNALGNFKQLVKAVTIEGMMLIYLNGFLNKKDAPDENYARELQELFTVGKDNPNHYTEDDVVAAAKVLTGWRLNFPTDNETYFYPVEHDFSNKQFSSFYNNTVITGSVNGEQELDALLDMIFQRPEVSEYICRKIYRWFIYYHIDDQIEQNIIQPLAEIFRNNNYEIKPVIETLLKSEHFFEAAQTGCFIKTPLDIVVGVMRSFNLTIQPSTPWDQLVMQFYLNSYMSAMGMLPGDPPNVAGWQAFRQVPQYYRVWINGDTVRNRNVFTDVMIAFMIDSGNDQLKINLVSFVSQFSNPGNPVQLVDDLTNFLLPQPISAAKKFLLKSILLSGLPADSYWTVAWTAYQTDPSNQMLFEVVNARLTALHLYMLRLPEFQLG
ncbi:MAG: DUF1800 domain-containing protein, partial [Saprospiraceae bacterium]|nr:DUF1800 domain-containing protein [Saprospiraceae bacterium]